MPWFPEVSEYGKHSYSGQGQEDENEKEILPKLVQRAIVPRLGAIASQCFDPLSPLQAAGLAQALSACAEFVAKDTTEFTVS
jgi:hypothetical protein